MKLLAALCALLLGSSSALSHDELEQELHELRTSMASTARRLDAITAAFAETDNAADDCIDSDVEVCRGMAPFCLSSKRIDGSQQWKDWMPANCRRTCSLCGRAPDAEATLETDEPEELSDMEHEHGCGDKDEDVCRSMHNFCESPKRIDEHWQWKEWMHANCEYTCGLCDLGDIDGAYPMYKYQKEPAINHLGLHQNPGNKHGVSFECLYNDDNVNSFMVSPITCLRKVQGEDGKPACEAHEVDDNAACARICAETTGCKFFYAARYSSPNKRVCFAVDGTTYFKDDASGMVPAPGGGHRFERCSGQLTCYDNKSRDFCEEQAALPGQCVRNEYVRENCRLTCRVCGSR